MVERNTLPESQAIIFISEPYIFYPSRSRLGEILQQADLISEKQILLAFHEQGQYPELKIGEILALRGWITLKTADFFAENWKLLLDQNNQYPLGYYLKEAGLLSEEQIARVLVEQETLWLRFGAVAVLKGWLKKTTLDFFLRHLFPDALSMSAHRNKRNNDHLSSARNGNQVLPEKMDTQVILQALNNVQLSPRERDKAEENLEEIPWVD
jgi:hypothetical protein